MNGNRIPMLVDTGASSVVLTPEDAVAVGLPIEFLRYDIPIDTANGRARAAAVVLDRIGIAGSIEERDVPALIASPGTLKHSLLGMTFLSRLASFEISRREAGDAGEGGRIARRLTRRSAPPRSAGRRSADRARTPLPARRLVKPCARRAPSGAANVAMPPTSSSPGSET
ncbi:TIGR02281 family clan AA aspartic protease [Ancylobacter dichloromethanicus]